jgi:hypothetical protein
MTRIAGLSLAGILLAALTGCVTTADAADPAVVEPPTTATTPTQSPTIIGEPALALGGDCAELIDEASLSELVGDVVTSADVRKSERVWAVSVLGGLDCSWSSDGDAYVWIDVLPAAGLEAQVSLAEKDSPYCYGGEPVESRCSFSAMVAGYWLSGIVGVANASDTTAIDAIDAITARLAEPVAGAALVPVVRPDGMWSAPAECSVLTEAVDTASILGSEFAAEKGSVGGEATSGFVAALHTVGNMSCNWAAPDSGRWFTSELLPGAGWVITQLSSRDGARPVTVDGAMEAVAVPLGGETTAVYATDGVNLARVTVPADIDDATAAVLTGAVVAAASR